MRENKVTRDGGRGTRKTASRRFRLVLLLGISAVLSSCGFHLRGVVELPPELESIYIKGGLPNSQMREILRQKLIASNVNVLEQPQESAALLRILKDETTRRIASINAAGQPNEYELKYTLAYQLDDGKGRPLLAAKTLSQLRTYRYDPNNILSIEEEEFRIKREMARAAVNQMLRQISAGMRHRDKGAHHSNPSGAAAGTTVDTTVGTTSVVPPAPAPAKANPD